MSDERRDERGAPEGDAGREGWLDRLILRFNPRSRDTVREDLEEVLAEADVTATFSAPERAMLRNVLSFHRVRVSDVMVPRADMVAVPRDLTLGALLRQLRDAGHSRLPVYGDSLDEPLGMVHIRDLVDLIAACAFPTPPPDGDAQPPSLGAFDLGQTIAAAGILRPVLFVPPSMPAIDLLASMQASQTHIAVVIDEYGGTDGLVSMEDLVEAVVGDIQDEHDETAATPVREPSGTLLVHARADLREVSEALGLDIGLAAGIEDVDTLGGLVAALAGRVPLRGESIAGPGGLSFEIVDADPRRIERVRIHGQAGAEAPPDVSLQAAPVRPV